MIGQGRATRQVLVVGAFRLRYTRTPSISLQRNDRTSQTPITDHSFTVSADVRRRAGCTAVRRGAPRAPRVLRAACCPARDGDRRTRQFRCATRHLVTVIMLIRLCMHYTRC